MLFKEFISMRSIRGLNDPIEMGLLPRINVYRNDLVPRDMDISGFENIPVDAVLLTHAHMDHYGMIGYLRFDIPLVASPETLAILKAYQDAGKTDDKTSVIYTTRREGDDSDVSIPIVRSTGSKIGRTKDREKIREYMLFRPLISTEEIGDELGDFLCLQGNDAKSEVMREDLVYESMDTLPFEVRAYPVDHSIYGAVGYIVNSPDGHQIAYTGDIRMHGERGGKTEEFVRMAKGSDILIIEGTRLADDREHHYTTERDVLENCSAAVGNERNLVIADFSARNFERLNMFAKIAQENERSLVVTEKDAYAIKGLLAAGTSIEMENILIYNKPTDRLEWWQRLLREDDFWSDRYVGPLEIRESPGEYILAFSLFDMPNLMDIKPEGGAYIYSSTEAFNEEMEMDFITLQNWLNRYGITPVGFSIKDGRPVFKRGYHASGHAAPEDIRRIIESIDPDIIIPVHTENPQWFVENFGEEKKVEIPSAGKAMKF